MVVLSQPGLDSFAHFKTCKPAPELFTGIPVVDLSDPDCKSRIVEACQEFGFFKLINHGVAMELPNRLEAEAMTFFDLPQEVKDGSGPPNPFGYGNKRIGPNGDVGWVEYLLFCTNAEANFPGIPDTLWCLVKEYVSRMKNLVCHVLELIGEELKIEAGDSMSKMIRDEKSDSCFRLNHYPACGEQLHALSGRNLIGFGEHTDPQIMSVVRSNNTSGLEICLRDGSWVAVPPDQASFYFNVGDSLQVMSNGRFTSVKHRVVADGEKSRVSMIYFGGPPLSEKIAPLVKEEESKYREFTWSQYKTSAYKTRLADDRLALFHKPPR